MLHKVTFQSNYPVRNNIHCSSIGFVGVESAENVALGKPAFQSGNYSGAVAGRAVDGITQIQTKEISEGGCTATAGRTKEEWWKVDLEKPYAIINITLFNRNGACKNSSV